MKYIKTFESFLSESVKNGVVTCNNKKCGWKWNLSQGGNDPYTCHKCGTKYNNLNGNPPSEGFQYHVENGLGISDSVYRLGSDAYKQLFEETKKYWDEGNVILNDKEAWMVKNLEVGKKAVYQGREVELDTPTRGGDKKFIVYHNSGRKDKDGNIEAKKIEWGDSSGLSIKNDDQEAAASFWARQQCDTKAKMDPLKPGFWACYGPSLYNKQLGLQSDMPW